MSWVLPLIIGGVVGAATAYPAGLSAGRATYENKKEKLREALLNRLPTVSVPEWIDLPSVLNWLQTCPSEEVLKWAIQALNEVIINWEQFADFVTALLESLKEAFEVRPTLAPSPRLTRKFTQKIMAKPFTETVEAKGKPIII